MKDETWELVELVSKLQCALAYAIEEADGWYDESTGHGKIKTPEMNEAVEVLAEVEQLLNRIE